MEIIITICDILVKFVSLPSIAALTAVFFGFQYYKRQKELDEVRRIFLVDGMEKMLDNLTNAYNAIEENHSIITLTVGEIEIELKKQTHLRDAESEKLRLSETLIRRLVDSDIPIFRFIHLLENEAIYHCYKCFMLDVNQAMHYFVDLAPALLLKQKRESKQVINMEAIKTQCKKYIERVRYWQYFLSELEKLTLRIRAMNITAFEDIEKVPKDEVVRKILTVMEKIVIDRKAKPDWGKDEGNPR